MKTLTIVIVNYNSKKFLYRCLQSLYAKPASTDFSTIVVDNHSKDSDFSSLSRQHPDVEFLKNQENRGFSKACNQGLARQKANFYLLLNPDCEVNENTIDRCIDFLEENLDVGILGCQILNPDGSLQRASRRSIPRPKSALYRLTGLSFLFPNSKTFSGYNLGFLDPKRSHPVEAVSGSFLLLRHSVYQELDGLDERFFLYGEDLDFCFRALQAGWKVYYFAGASVVHHKGGSSSTTPRESNQHFYEAMKIFYQKHSYDDPWLLRVSVKAGIQTLSWISKLRFVSGSRRVGSRG